MVLRRRCLPLQDDASEGVIANHLHLVHNKAKVSPGGNMTYCHILPRTGKIWKTHLPVRKGGVTGVAAAACDKVEFLIITCLTNKKCLYFANISLQPEGTLSQHQRSCLGPYPVLLPFLPT